MSDLIKVKRKSLGPGFFVVFGSDQGATFHIWIKRDVYGSGALIVWGLSRWGKVIGYRTLGVALPEWLARSGNEGARFFLDSDWTEHRGAS